MPNIEAAIALAEGTATDSASDAAESTAPPSGAESSAVESAAEPVEAAPTQADLLKERIAKIKEGRQARSLDKERAEFHKAQQEFRRTQQGFESERSSWKDSLRTKPIEALRSVGIDPLSHYEAVTAAALAEDTPEARLKREVEPIRKQTEELKAYLEAQKRHETERSFVGLFNEAAYQDLADEYDEGDLIAMGDAAATKLAKSGEPFTLKDIADQLLADYTRRQQRKTERRSQRAPAATKSEPASAGAEQKPGMAAQATKAVGNSLSSESASSTPAKLTREQRLAKAAEMMAAPRKRTG